MSSTATKSAKAIVSGLVTFAGGAVVSLEANNAAPSLTQWLIAGVFGLGALVTTYVVPNAKDKPLVGAAEKVAVDVIDHKPAQIAPDATALVEQYWKTQFVKGNAPPPVPVTVSAEPLSTVAGMQPIVPVKPAYTGPIPPVSEPVGATAVSATP